VENLGAGAKGLGEGWEVLWHDHELLEINRSIAVRAAVEDVHHRHGKHLGVGSAEVFVKGLADLRGGGLCGRERDSEDGIGSDFLFRRRAVHCEHGFIHRNLICSVEADQSGREKLGNIGNGFGHALAEVAGFVSIAELNRLVLTCAGTAGNCCTANSSAGEFDIGFDGGIAARIEDLAGANGKNGCVGHGEF